MSTRYERALKLPTSTANKAAVAALSRAHELRKFEIENYWKRANYFWLFQAASWTFFGLVISRPEVSRDLALLPAGLGAVTGFAAYLTSRGSKFWQENWEFHVDRLEALVEGRLTQVVFVGKGLRASVSRVNEKLFVLLTFGWTVTFCVIVLSPLVHLPATLLTPLSRSSWVVMLICALVALGLGTRSRLSGQAAGAAGQSVWKRFGKSKQKSQLMLLRDTSAGRAKAPKTPA